jgi:hypothetical protein
VKLLLLILLLASCAWSAAVEGSVFDEETKNALARATVMLIPLPGNTAAPPPPMLANDRGSYSFQNVPPGWYIIRATRVGYAVAEYGQSRPGRPGTPVEIANDTPSNSPELRQIVMRHLAAITGTVVDDNVIGIPGWPVSLYTAHQPVRRVAEATTNDRGDFRIGELDPGAYLLRSGGGALDDLVTLVPAYFKYGTAVATAEPVRVRLGETQNLVLIRPVEGALLELTGTLLTPDNRPARLTLITDTGRRVIAGAPGDFTATSVPPGMIEFLVEGAKCASYQRALVDRNSFARVECAAMTPPQIEWWIDGRQVSALPYPVVGHRVDLDGPGPDRTLAAGETLSPGRWEFTVRTGASHYLVSFQEQSDHAAPGRPDDGWFGVEITNSPHLRVNLSAKPASISGIVSSRSKPVIGAPVFVELINPDNSDQPLQSWTYRTDALGNFSLGGLAPGSYHLLSSFDLDYTDPGARNTSVTVNLREGDSVTQPLDMIVF